MCFILLYETNPMLLGLSERMRNDVISVRNNDGMGKVEQFVVKAPQFFFFSASQQFTLR